MALPTVVSGSVLLVMVYLVFRSSLNVQAAFAPMDAWQHFRDPKGAIFGGVLFGVCVVLIAVSNWLPIPLWVLTLIFGAIMLTKDVAMDFFALNRDQFDELTAEKPSTEQVVRHVERKLAQPESDDENVMVALDEELSDSEFEMTEIREDSESSVAEAESPPTKPHFYASVTVLSRLPWKVAPFVIGVFILVEALNAAGFTGSVASALSRLFGPEDSARSVFAASFVLGGSVSLLCNLLNNQPATILITHILQHSQFEAGDYTKQVAQFASVMGSNYGGNLTLVGALAGIMWSSILKAKGVDMSPLLFSKYGVVIMTPIIALGCLTLAAEFATLI